MKKLYTLLLALCPAVLAMASLPLQQGPAQFKLVPQTSEAKQLQRSKHTSEVLPVADGMKKAPAKAHESDEWEVLGEGDFKEGLVLGVYGLQTALDLKAEFAKSKTTEGLYRVSNPYKAVADNYPSVFSYDATVAEPLYLQVVDGDKFYLEGFNTGLTDLEDNSVITVTSQAANLIAGNSLETVLSVVPEAFGDFSMGYFDFGGPQFTLSGKTYYDYLVVIAGGNYAGNKYGVTKLVPPGVDVKDYSITVDYENCADGNKFGFQFAFGTDVEKVKIMYVQGEYPASVENLAYVVESGQEFAASEAAQGISLDLSAGDDGVYTLFAVTLDAAGALAKGTYAWVYVIQDNDDQWKSFESKGEYTDDIVSSIYNEHAAAAHEVEVQENIATPGFYRLVNPYAEPYQFAQENVGGCTHKHYIYINAVDPEKVYLLESPIGWELGDGAMVVSSLAYMNIQNEADPSAYYGTLADGVITFPQKALVAREMKYQEGTWYYANSNNAFKVQLPDDAGVNDVIADDAEAPVEYYNLQGVRIDAPSAGQLVIRRQGSSVSKQLVH